MILRIFFFLLIAASMTAAQSPLYKNPSVPVEERVLDVLKRMTLEEKLEMLSGTGFASKPLPRLGIPSLDMADGPVGVRWDTSTAFPASIMLAATFDTALAYRYGWALARETKAKKRNTILAPCVNINRVPHGGRNFESFGEDPFLTSRIAVSFVKGVQSEGVAATTKHFAVNNQETDRMFIDARVGKRALYEIYFPAFKAAVQEAKTKAIMSAYNKLNGDYCSENEMLLNTVLKNEWNFDGLVMSDWGAVHSTEGTARFGLDLEMPGGEFLTKENLLPLVSSGTIPIATIDDKVRRILRVMFRMGLFDKSLDMPAANDPAHRSVALDVARDGIVLLKNENTILPLHPDSVVSIAVIGPNADVLRTGGGGSSMVVPATRETPLEGVKKSFRRAAVSYAIGARLSGDVPAIDPQYWFLSADPSAERGVQAEYFANKEMKGKPVLRRIDPNIDFRWGGNAPADGIGKDNFSVRWKGTLRPPITGPYELTAASDDGIRVFLNGKLLLDHWSDHAIEARTAEITMKAGSSYDIIVEFYENGGDAAAILGWTLPHSDELKEAVELAKRSDIAIIVAGNSHFQESEGFDRPSIDLPENQIRLITEVSRVNKNTIVIMNAGAQVNLMPWIDHVRALVWTFFPGQEGTQALMEILTGVRSPSGKLPFTIARRWEDYPAYGNYPGEGKKVEYLEELLVGYRHFDTKKIETHFPFGFGLSYTTFSLSDLNIRPLHGGRFEVSLNVRNTGPAAGAEVIQVYVKDNAPALFRPEKELKAFTKIFLQPGEEKNVTLQLNSSSFEFYDDRINQWSRSTGGYTVLVGTSSGTISLKNHIQP